MTMFAWRFCARLDTLVGVCGGATLYLDPLTQADFDVLHSAGGGDGLLGRLNAMAFGRAYPRRVEPFGQCSPALLRLAAAGLNLKAGDHLVDLGCGRAGRGSGWRADAGRG